MRPILFESAVHRKFVQMNFSKARPAHANTNAHARTHVSARGKYRCPTHRNSETMVAHTRTHAFINARTNAHTNTHAHTPTHTYSLNHAHTPTPTHTITRTHPTHHAACKTRSKSLVRKLLLVNRVREACVVTIAVALWTDFAHCQLWIQCTSAETTSYWKGEIQWTFRLFVQSTTERHISWHYRVARRRTRLQDKQQVWSAAGENRFIIRYLSPINRLFQDETDEIIAFLSKPSRRVASFFPIDSFSVYKLWLSQKIRDWPIWTSWKIWSKLIILSREHEFRRIFLLIDVRSAVVGKKSRD